jgi:two-component system chemotaxis response regulator CheB
LKQNRSPLVPQGLLKPAIVENTITTFKPKTNTVIVIGASAGGYTALIKLICQFAPDFPAPILIVQHISADASGDVLLDGLNKFGQLKCVHAVNDDLLQNGVVTWPRQITI